MKKKICYFLIFIFLFLYGIKTDFQTVDGFKSWMLIAPGIFLVVWAWIATSHLLLNMSSSSMFEKCRNIGIFYLSVFFSLFFIFNSALPSIYTRFFGEYVSKDVVVVELGPRRSKDSCNYKIKVEGYRKKLCTYRYQFERLEIGDKIHMYGYKTRFGFKLKEFGIITKQ